MSNNLSVRQSNYIEKVQKYIGFLYITVLRCPVYFPPKNGRPEGSACGTVYGSVCRWQCNKGYENKGSTLRECDKAVGANQVYWTGNATYCEGRDLTRSMVWNNINCYYRSTSKWLANSKTICIKPSKIDVFLAPTWLSRLNFGREEKKIRWSSTRLQRFSFQNANLFEDSSLLLLLLISIAYVAPFTAQQKRSLSVANLPKKFYKGHVEDIPYVAFQLPYWSWAWPSWSSSFVLFSSTDLYLQADLSQALTSFKMAKIRQILFLYKDL